MPDDDFDRYPSGEPGYNRQTGQPYFNVGINSRFAESDDSDIDELIVDDSLNLLSSPTGHLTNLSTAPDRAPQ